MATTMVFRKTNSQTGGMGRHTRKQHESASFLCPHYSESRCPGGLVPNPGQETGLIVLAGSAKVTSAGRRVELHKYDAMYIPCDSGIDIASDSTDIAEFSSDVSERLPMQVVRYHDVAKDERLQFTVGSAGQQRSLRRALLGKNVQATGC